MRNILDCPGIALWSVALLDATRVAELTLALLRQALVPGSACLWNYRRITC